MAAGPLIRALCCPETHQGLAVAEPALLEELNRQIEARQLRNRAGQILEEQVESGLVRQDQTILYPVRQSIPILLMDEGIPLAQLWSRGATQSGTTPG